MKKILQRIGLLAMAGMLLWGWQGMEAKAEVTDDTIGLVRDYTKLEKDHGKTTTTTMRRIDRNIEWLSICQTRKKKINRNDSCLGYVRDFPRVNL